MRALRFCERYDMRTSFPHVHQRLQIVLFTLHLFLMTTLADTALLAFCTSKDPGEIPEHLKHRHEAFIASKELTSTKISFLIFYTVLKKARAYTARKMIFVLCSCSGLCINKNSLCLKETHPTTLSSSKI